MILSHPLSAINKFLSYRGSGKHISRSPQLRLNANPNLFGAVVDGLIQYRHRDERWLTNVEDHLKRSEVIQERYLRSLA